MDDASGLAPGKQLGKYRLEGLLGRGGMGEVWAAHDPDLDRKVALKILRAAASNEDARLRLLREGRAMARLRHPNVITVYEATAADGRDVIAMELIDGKSLAGWLAEHREPDAIVATLLAAGRGLAAAHAAGMIHRDFKPHNVLVDRDGRVVVTDFGLARGIEADAGSDGSASASVGVGGSPALTPTPTPTADLGSAETVAPDATLSVSPVRATSSDATTDRAALHSPLTRTGALLGTPAYMAPEQLAGETADARSDQYAFCVTAWEALAGTRPFVGATFTELHDAVDAGKPTGGDKLPPRLRPLIARGLARAPAERWPTMDALLGAIDAAWRRPRRIKIAAAVTAGVLALAAIPVVMWLRGGAGATGPCPGADAAFGPANAAELRTGQAALAALGPSGKRFAGGVDHWRTAWTATYRQVCAEPNSPEFLARRACLDSARDDMVRALRMAAFATRGVLSATDPGAQVMTPDGCFANPRAVAPPAPADPARAAEVERIRGALMPYRPQQPATPELLAAVDQLVAAAEATGHDPTIAETLATKGDRLLSIDPAKAWDAYADALAHAEKAGADVLAIDALLGELEAAQRLREHQPEIDGLIARASNAIERIDAKPKRARLDIMHAHVLAGRYQFDEAIALAEKARGEWLALDASIEGLRAAIDEAEILIQRSGRDDLHRAEVALRDAMMKVPTDADDALQRTRRMLGNVLWWLGRLDEAVTLLNLTALPPPEGDLDIVVHVVGSDGAPAERADVEATIDPMGDPIRLVRTEWKPTVATRTDEHGTATLRVPRGALVLARKSSEQGGVLAATAGSFEIRLQPTAYINGTVTLPSGPPPADPRAGQRFQMLAAATVWIDDHPWSLVSPISADGRFHLSMVPGRAVVEVEGITGLGDNFSTATPIDLVAGSQNVALELAPRVYLRVIARPAMDGLILVVPGTHAVKGWADIAKLTQGAPRSFAVGAATDPVTRAKVKDGDVVQVGDMVVEVAAPGAGPLTVCALPRTSSPAFMPLPILTLGADTAPPVCVTTTVADGTTTTVVVPTRK